MIAETRESPHTTEHQDVLWAGAIPTPWGDFGAVFSEAGLQVLSFPGEPLPLVAPDGPPPEAADTLRAELTQYLNGERREFTVPLDLRGTPFQQAVWRVLREIPYGQVRSYAWVAAQVDRPSAVRAVGAANGRNPVAIVVPCHRVIGSNGALTGYGGGIALKERLLRLEGALLA